jgi:predicted Zn-ribbon and HTH transcriptional regulator
MACITKDEDSDYDNNNNTISNNSSKCSKCSKCSSGDMIEHPSFFSMPLTSRSKIAEKVKTAIEDQDAEFVLKFVSCRNCRYSEFYLVKDDITWRV